MVVTVHRCSGWYEECDWTALSQSVATRNLSNAGLGICAIVLTIREIESHIWRLRLTAEPGVVKASGGKGRRPRSGQPFPR
jgi:hypothetical protein